MVSIQQSPSSVKRPVRWRKDKPSVLKGKITRLRTPVRAVCTPVLFERSILMERDRACAFALAMQARADIDRADFVRDHHVTTAARWYVRFLRKTVPLTLTPSLRRMQDVRAQRAADQVHEMEFVPCLDRAGWYYTIHQYPDEAGQVGVYETHVTEGCKCPDDTYRLRSTDVVCKHVVNLRVKLGWKPAMTVLIPRQETADEKQARQARLRAARALDF